MKYTSLRTAIVVLSLSIVPAAYGAGVESPSVRAPVMDHRMDSSSDQIVEGSKVTLQYVATAYGTRVTDYGDISEFIQGEHAIFPALERELVGMKPGEEKKIELSPGESFGPHDDSKKGAIPKTQLPVGAKAGDVLQNDAGELATVEEVGDSMAELDYNHPLAGKPLMVKVKILKVENP
ncbi:MAG: FKBP-type peptidyl-prolyl cis-trans isomerase [Nitrospirales bacterium]